MSWRDAVPGLVLDPWRFDPGAATEAVALAVGGGPSLVQAWADEASGPEEAVAATIVVRLVVEPVPVRGQADTFRPEGPPVPHHPFVFSRDVAFLPARVLSVGGAVLGPADFVRSCLEHGAFRTKPLAPADPREAVDELLASSFWSDLIDPSALGRATTMVRWQAARALGHPELLEGIDPATASPGELEHWWGGVAGAGAA
jgi:hypothetical protein